MLNNLPARFMAGVARVLTLPFGKPYRRPDDALGQRVANILMQPGELRDRLTEGVYIPADNNESVARLEDALIKSIAAEAVIRKLRTAMKTGTLPKGDPEDSLADGVKAKVIDEQEAEAVRAAIAARKLVIQVDDFPPEYFTKEQNAWGIDSLDGVAGQSM